MTPRPLSLEEFRIALDDLGLTQIAFSEMVGVDVMTVSRWARGRIDVPLWVGLVLHLLRRERDRTGLLPDLPSDLPSLGLIPRDLAGGFAEGDLPEPTPGPTSAGSGGRTEVRVGSGVNSDNDDREDFGAGPGNAGS
jgi:transcriptional regulator with XRE-family HTH domain